MRKVIQINNHNFLETVAHDSLPVLVDVWQSDCLHCRKLVPIISRIADRFQGKLIVGQMQADPHRELTVSLALRMYPTLLLFDQGRDILRIEGFVPQPEIERQLATYLS